jgi:hypothetical protein
LPEQRWLNGKVVDSLTMQPVGGVGIYYHSAEGDSSSSAMAHVDGAFRIPVLAGKGTLRLQPPLYGFYFPTSGLAKSAPTEIDIPAAGDVEPVTLSAMRGLVIRGIVRDAQKTAVAGVEVQAVNTDQPYHSMIVRTDVDGRFQLTGFSPRVEVLVTVLNEAGAATSQVPAEMKQSADRVVSLDLDLKAGVTLVGSAEKDGKPASHVRLKVTKSIGSEQIRQWHFGHVVTDDEGRYRVPGFTEGDHFSLTFDLGSDFDAVDWEYDGGQENVVGAGPEIKLPPAKLIGYQQVLRGVVVDPNGKPVAGAAVSAQLMSGDGLRSRQNGSQPWIATDADGSFELSQLPSQPLQLMAYMEPRGLKDRRILFPTTAQPKLNQTDIRIVLDPELVKEIEDLDPVAKDPGKK